MRSGRTDEAAPPRGAAWPVSFIRWPGPPSIVRLQRTGSGSTRLDDRNPAAGRLNGEILSHIVGTYEKLCMCDPLTHSMVKILARPIGGEEIRFFFNPLYEPDLCLYVH